MSILRKSKQYNLIDMFNDTSRYLDDIFTIDNLEFEKHIPDIYPSELLLNKAYTSGKETSFLDLNIEVKNSDVHTSVYDKPLIISRDSLLLGSGLASRRTEHIAYSVRCLYFWYTVLSPYMFV